MQNLNAKFLQYTEEPRSRGGKAPAQGEPGTSSIIFLKSIYDNLANQFCKYKTLAKMCEECITHNKLNVHQSNLKIDFLLLSRTFLPVGVAYKTTENHGFS